MACSRIVSAVQKLLSSYDRGFVRVLLPQLSDEGIKYLVKDENASSMGEIAPLVASQLIVVR